MFGIKRTDLINISTSLIAIISFLCCYFILKNDIIVLPILAQIVCFLTFISIMLYAFEEIVKRNPLKDNEKIPGRTLFLFIFKYIGHHPLRHIMYGLLFLAIGLMMGGAGVSILTSTDPKYTTDIYKNFGFTYEFLGITICLISSYIFSNSYIKFERDE